MRSALFASLLGIAAVWTNVAGDRLGGAGRGRQLQTSNGTTDTDSCAATLDNGFDESAGLAMTVYILLLFFVFQGVAGKCTHRFVALSPRCSARI